MLQYVNIDYHNYNTFNVLCVTHALSFSDILINDVSYANWILFRKDRTRKCQNAPLDRFSMTPEQEDGFYSNIFSVVFFFIHLRADHSPPDWPFPTEIADQLIKNTS